MFEWRVGAEYDAEYLRRESGVLQRWLFNHRNESPIRSGLIWCRRRDLNPHGLRHTPLKRACLPFHHFGTWQEFDPPQLRSRVAQTLNVQKRTLGCRNHLRDFSVRHDPSKGRTAHTKYSLYLLGLMLAAALLQGFLKLLHKECSNRLARCFVPAFHALRTPSYRGSRIIEVGQNPCQSIDGPVESGGAYSPDPPTLCRVTTTSLPCSMIPLNDGHRGPSLRCSTSTTRSSLEWPARYDSSGFCGGADWWDGAS